MPLNPLLLREGEGRVRVGHRRRVMSFVRALGFTEIAPYYDTPIECTVFMSLKLS
jgi:hypothetical protein